MSVRLALLPIRLDNLASALAVSRKAERLEPPRAGYQGLRAVVRYKPSDDR